MVLGDLWSCINLVKTHIFTMALEGRRVFAGPVLTLSPGFFILGFWSRLVVCRYLFFWIGFRDRPVFCMEALLGDG
jgi:hypothetical protein